MEREIELEIEKLAQSGQGVGRAAGRTVFAWNALPGEEVRLLVQRKRRGILEGVATEILRPSPYRIESRENHYLSCSAWQILNFDEEQRWKAEITRETFKKVANLDLGELTVVTNDRQYGYRNKMEFSFMEQNEILSLAFHERYTRILTPIEGCLLADDNISRTSKKIIEWLRGQGVRADALKTLILRSNRAGEIIGALFMKSKNAVIALPPLDEIGLKGFANFYSDPQSPASVPTELINSEGELSLGEVIKGKTLRYGLMSFFQVNLPMFERALEAMAPFIKSDELLDLYCGVGSIGITLADRSQKCTLVENDHESVRFAAENVETSGLSGCQVIALPAEKTLAEIISDRAIILDPPRPGLHPKVVKRLLEVQPTRIIYLACNVASQARDLALLTEHYQIVHAQLFNFFPRTPHVESLLVLDRKS